MSTTTERWNEQVTGSDGTLKRGIEAREACLEAEAFSNSEWRRDGWRKRVGFWWEIGISKRERLAVVGSCGKGSRFK
jgi:hypothetical protein